MAKTHHSDLMGFAHPTFILAVVYRRSSRPRRFAWFCCAGATDDQRPNGCACRWVPVWRAGPTPPLEKRPEGSCSPKVCAFTKIHVVLLCRHNKWAPAKWVCLLLGPRGARPRPNAFWEKPEGSLPWMAATVPSRQEAAWERAGPKRRSGSGGVARIRGVLSFGYFSLHE